MALGVYLLFKVNIENLVRGKLVWSKEFNIQPSEIDRMPYWEYEMLREDIADYMKEKQKQNDQQEKEHSNYHSMMKNPKLPNAPKMPNFSIPKI
jgi:hypothetical protein